MNKSKNSKIIKFIVVILILTLPSFTAKAADLSKSKCSETKVGILNLPIEVIKSEILQRLLFETVNKSDKKEVVENIKKNLQKIACVNKAFYNIINDQKFTTDIINLASAKYGISKLEIAAIFNTDKSIKFIEKLMENNDFNYYETLFWAAENGYAGVVKLLLSYDNIVNIQDFDGHTILIIAAAYGHADIVKLLFGYQDININAQDLRGKTALIFAANNNHIEVVRLLLSRYNININAQDFLLNNTALITAVDNGNIEVVRLLLNDIRTNVNIKTNWRVRLNFLGHTALMVAAKGGRTEIVKLLLDHNNTDIYAQNNRGQTALDIAKLHNRQEIVKLINEHIWLKSSCTLS